MTDLSELLAKLEAAEGPSRELDAELAKLDGLTHPVGVLGVECPLYTSCLNAITALVEASLPPLKHFSDQPSEGWKFGVYRLVLPGSWTAWIRKHGEDGVDAKARTPALALCIALVKAKQAEASL